MQGLQLRWCRSLLVPALLALPAALVAQAATITGRVTGDGGAPLIGVTVSIPGLGVGSTTRDDGQYTFTVPAGRVTGQMVTLNARRVGYTPQNATITLSAGTISHDFVMAAAARQLEQVIVTGAGTSQVRERVGSVINSVDSSLIARETQPQNIISSLAATAPNVRVSTQSGEPGASAFVIIRGATSVTGTNQPLIVVDNQPIDNTTLSTNGGDGSTVTQNRAADLNPNDIESVQILKGAAASAIYGARAANGVILITTKKGAQRSDALCGHVDADVRQRDQDGAAAKRIRARAAAETPALRDARLRRVEPDVGTARSPPGTPVFDHGKEIYHTGLTSDNALSVSGGNARTTFYLSGGVTDQLGVMKGGNNRYDRTTVKLSAAHQLLEHPHVRRQLLVLQHDGRVRAERLEHVGPAARRAPHVAGLQQPAVPRSDLRVAAVVSFPESDVGERHRFARLRQSVLRARQSRQSQRARTLPRQLDGELGAGGVAQRQRDVRRRQLHRLARRGASADVVERSGRQRDAVPDHEPRDRSQSDGDAVALARRRTSTRDSCLART